MPDPNPRVAGSGIKILDDAGINTRVGLLEAEARKLNPGFCKRMEQGLPYTRCKMAMSVDGRTALANGKTSVTWDYFTLAAFLTNPQAYYPGTKMASPPISYADAVQIGIFLNDGKTF